MFTGMKRIALTPQIEQHLRRSLGDSAGDLSTYAIYEAVALNTQPLRKNHPVYKDARMDSSVLYEMAASLRSESRPIQIEHDKSVSPIGRVFHGEVIDSVELRTLFFIDPSETTVLSKLDSGTIDQVSVSVLTKQVLNSVSGFDYIGPDATLEHFFSGDDGEGNVLGQNGVFARLVGLDSFFEMSLVGQGGARGARIVSRDDSYFGTSYKQMAASGLDPSVYVLTASATPVSPTKPEENPMDMAQLIADLTSKGVDLEVTKQALTAAQAEATRLTAELAAAQERVTALEAQVAETPDAEKLQKTEADLSAATEALTNVATILLTASGQTDKIEGLKDSNIASLTAVIDESKTTLAAKLTAGGVSQGADRGDILADKPVANLSGAYRVSRN